MAKSTPHTHAPANTPCVPSDVDLFLADAERLVQRRDQKMTPIRRKVLRLLVERRAPAKAYDLLAHLDGQGAAKPPTIYRALDFLQSMGLAHKIESLNAYVACGHTSHTHAAVFLICDACCNAEELHAPATDQALKAEAQSAGFHIERAVIEVRGRCRVCMAA